MNKSGSQTALILEFTTTEKDVIITILNMLKKLVKMEKCRKVLNSSQVNKKVIDGYSRIKNKMSDIKDELSELRKRHEHKDMAV